MSSCLSLTLTKTSMQCDSWQEKSSKNKLGKRLLVPPPPPTQWPLWGQYAESGLAKEHHYAKDKKEYLSISLFIILYLYMIITMKFLSQWNGNNAGARFWAYWFELWNDNTRSEFCPQINAACVFLKHMVYAVSVWQKHLCLKYSLTVPCHLAKQCGLFRTNLLWLTTERCMCVSEPLPMNRQKDHLGTWHLHIFEQS